MNRLLLALKRPLVRLCRFPRRRGYGVHSPFAFDLITQVIFQPAPYYKYRELADCERRLAREKGKSWLYEPRRVRRLLFRLVNEVQPDSVVDVGRLSASSLYLRAAREAADYTAASSLEELFLERDVPVDFLYVHQWQNPALVEEVFRLCAARSRSRSLFVVEGIRYSAAMHSLWKRMCADERVGVTFDLYDLGLLFFDRSMQKQHYLVNF